LLSSQSFPLSCRKNGSPFFFVHEIDENVDVKGEQQFTKLRIMLAGLLDMRTRSKCFGYTILGGAYFMLFMPSVPEFLTNADNVMALHAKQTEKCEHAKKGHLAAANFIELHPDVKTSAFLFELPYICNADLNADTAPIVDQKLRVAMMDEAVVKGTVTEGEETFEISQEVEPCFFDLRKIVEEDEKKVLKIAGDDDGGSDIAKYFKSKAAKQNGGGGN
jgi:hypothetical protein